MLRGLVGLAIVLFLSAWAGADNVSCPMAASGDDAYATSTGVLYAQTTIFSPYSSNDRRSYLRWAIGIPQGSVITSASLRLKSAGQQGSAATSTIRLQRIDSDNCPALTVNPFTWAVTAGFADWTLPAAWADGQWHTSGDIAPLVQEFIDRPGYVPGRYLGLRVAWVSGPWKRVYAWDNSTHADGPVLDITYDPPGTNQPPVAAAGPDQFVTDADLNGVEPVTLNGSGSTDADGAIAGYVWREGPTQIATGATAQINLGLGVHTLTLTVTDNAGGVATDYITVTITVPAPNVPPVAAAGPDQSVVDNDGSLAESVTLNGAASSDSDGFIVSYAWYEGTTLVGAGPTVQASLAVGSHTITLQVTDDDGATASDTVTVVVAAAPASQARLSYAGDDIANADGTMTITCSQRGTNLWALDLTRATPASTSYRIRISRFDDLGDGGTFNYADANAGSSGLWSAHHYHLLPWQVESIQELHKGADYYSFKVVNRYYDPASGLATMEVVTTYVLSPATVSGTHFSADATVANISGGPLTFQGSAYAIKLAMGLGVGPYDVNAGAYLTPYVNGLSVHTQANAAQALWQISDNVDKDNDQRQQGQSVWGQGLVLGNAATQGLGLTAGRTVRFSSDLANTQPWVSNFDVRLQDESESDRIAFWVNPQDWGQGAGLAANETKTRHAALDINIAAAPPNRPPVANAGPDQLLVDTNGDGLQAVTLNGTASADPDGALTGFVWRVGSVQVGSGASPSVSLAVGTHIVTLLVTDDAGDTAEDSVAITILPQGSNLPPVAEAGRDRADVDADGDGRQTVTLNASGSSDPDGVIAGYVWTDSGTQIASGALASVDLAVGWHDIQLVVTDASGANASDVVRIWIAPRADYFVDQQHPDASDSNPGTEALPLKTVSRAVALASAGKTILVKEGVYRERVSIAASGAPGSPITLMGYPFHRVALAGSDRLTGWTPCTSATAKGNPNWLNIRYVDIPWKPTRLVQDDQDMTEARQPALGEWFVTGGSTTTVVDATNLTQADGHWVGATIRFYDVSDLSHVTRAVTAFDAATHTLTLDSALPSSCQAGVDSYVLSGLVQSIDAPGEYAIESLGGGSYRLYAWAFGGADPDASTVEASRREWHVVGLGRASYWVFDNLEIRHAIGYGIGTDVSGGLGHNVFQNCSAHHNDTYGFSVAYMDYSTVRRCYAGFNNVGINSAASSHVLIEDNEMAWNGTDGIHMTGPGAPGWATDVTVRRNYMHDHFHGTGGHPDNAQTYANIGETVMDGNLMIAGGQNYIIQQSRNMTITNNVLIGSFAVSLILGGGSQGFTVERNTLLYSGLSLVSYDAVNGNGFHWKDNVLFVGHDSAVWGEITAANDYTSDYNCFWRGEGLSLNKSPVGWNGQSNWTFAQYTSGSGQDTHSVYADPQLENVPTYCVGVKTEMMNLSSATRLYVANNADTGLFQVGDHIEVDFDGTLRTVTAVGLGYVEFTPGDDRFFRYAVCLANWKDRTDNRLDIRPKAGSPARGASSTGGNMGSSLDIAALMAGDFNGDGRRDIPAWPPLSSPPAAGAITGWAVACDTAAGEVACSVVLDYVESRVAGVTRVLVTASAPLDPATVGVGAISITGQLSGDQATRIAAVSLRPGNTVMVVDLASALPDGDRYTIAVSPTVTLADGGAVTDGLCHLSTLAGDVDSSGAVGPADILAVRRHAGRGVTGETIRYDVDNSGVIGGADLLTVRSRMGRALP